jgi:hypothetical protein
MKFEQEPIKKATVDGLDVFIISNEKDLRVVIKKQRPISMLIGNIENVFWGIRGYDCPESEILKSNRVFMEVKNPFNAREMDQIIANHNKRLIDRGDMPSCVAN